MCWWPSLAFLRELRLFVVTFWLAPVETGPAVLPRRRARWSIFLWQLWIGKQSWKCWSQIKMFVHIQFCLLQILLEMNIFKTLHPIEAHPSLFLTLFSEPTLIRPSTPVCETAICMATQNLPKSWTIIPNTVSLTVAHFLVLCYKLSIWYTVNMMYMTWHFNILRHVCTFSPANRRKCTGGDNISQNKKGICFVYLICLSHIFFYIIKIISQVLLLRVHCIIILAILCRNIWIWNTCCSVSSSLVFDR